MTLTAVDLADASTDRLMESLREGSYGATVSATMVLDALARRENERQTARVVVLTWAIAVMTGIVAFATVVNVAVYLVRG